MNIGEALVKDCEKEKEKIISFSCYQGKSRTI